MADIDGFKVVKLLTTKESSIGHDIFIKEHSIRHKSADKPDGHTLFILNVPPYVTKQHLKDVFAVAGKVRNVLFAEKATAPSIPEPANQSKFFPQKELFAFKVAFVIFDTPRGLNNALELTELPAIASVSQLLTGVEKWKLAAREKLPLNDDELQNDVDVYMANFDMSTEKRAQLEKDMEEEDDDDGWVTVGKKGTYAGFEQKESVVNKLQKKIETGKQRKELVNFYSFQIRESKMKNIINLRRKFDQDKQKIEAIKKTRRFRPF